MARRQATRDLGRMSEIAQVAVKHGFGYFLERNRLTDLLPWPRPAPEAAEAALGSARGEHLRAMLDELGPTFVKFGQLLSTRPDVVPPDIIAELRKLQDEVSPFPFEQVEAVIEAELGLSLDKLFLEFSPQPLAAASIGQVHEAVLPNGRRVAVKVQRPTAERQIEADLSLLRQAARLAKERVRALDFIDAPELVEEFARSIRQELDYRLEARNAQTFHRNFAGHPHVRIPRVYWSYSRQRVLTLEFLEGVQLVDLDLDEYTLEAPPARLPHHRGLDDHDLPARLLPRGPPSRQYPRAGQPRARGPGRLRPGGEALPGGHGPAHAALHRRRRGAGGGAAQALERSRRPLRPPPRGGAGHLPARAVRPLLRRSPGRDRPPAGD
ncbi:MAG: hypothetical protein C4307_05705 [Chloroflexota bacterium]